MVDQRITGRLRQLESVAGRINTSIIQRIDGIIREAERLARRVRVCPKCGQQMERDSTMYRCPGCGLCRDDGDEPTAEFAPPGEVDL